ncbi:AraC family transcriptional regulator [Micromonospora sp. WMMC241]|uniref:helix-turn-helix transcriptional regulator n=1 Tax=Micromonospora sp. WMMC241 TaxID=3015159 RepID=UPI0022B5FB83|nr:AraC family transcriptional regulator [Micromonospora sp. WMMC241]MCZ7436963.1 AraC family transcriptional regulator [Micromonospora sp. WMMC241]
MTTGTGAVPVRRHEVVTCDPEVACQAILALTKHRVVLGRPRPGFRFALRTRQAGPLGLDRMAHSMEARSLTGPYADFMAVHVVRGRLGLAAGRTEVRTPPGGVRTSAPVPSWVSWTDLGGMVVRLPTERVALVAAVRAEAGPQTFRFLGFAPVSTAMVQAWVRLSSFLHELSDDAMAQPLVQASLVDLAAATALAVFPNTTMTVDYLPQPSRVAPPVVRRAQAYLDEHAAEPVTVAQVAAACGVGARALQAAFHRHVGHSPLTYLRRVRLARAHRDLVTAEPGGEETVAAIARRWGWASPGRFAAAYRQTYGRSPGETLRG